MKALSTLIRMNRWRLNEQRRELAEYEKLLDKLHGEAARLAAELVAEQETASRREVEGLSPANWAFAGFARATLERQRKLASSIAEVEGRAETAREVVRGMFRELKRHEITLDLRNRREREEAERRAQAELDEVSMERHRRRGHAGGSSSSP